MRLLLISATPFELGETAAWLGSRPTHPNSRAPELLYTGVGQMQAAYAITRSIFQTRPDIIIQAGIGGSTHAADIGKVFAIRSERLADLGACEESGFADIFELGLGDRNLFPYQDGLLPNPYAPLLELAGLPLADGLTVNEIKSGTGHKRNAQPFVESMEGAALHYVCLLERIPFLQIRSISNETGVRDKARWKMKEALTDLNATLISLIKKLEQVKENNPGFQSLS